MRVEFTIPDFEIWQAIVAGLGVYLPFAFWMGKKILMRHWDSYSVRNNYRGTVGFLWVFSPIWLPFYLPVASFWPLGKVIEEALEYKEKKESKNG
jgi:hypothetical protein